MTQIAQLSEAEIEARFHITGARPVAFLLAGFAKENEPFSVQFGADAFLTTLLAVRPGRGELIFDCSGSSETNARLLGCDRLLFVGRPGGVHVQFSTGRATELLHGGAKAFSVALPKFVVRLQRREFFRIETPRVRPLMFFGRLPDGGLLNQAVHDISVTGIGLNASSLPDGVSVGQGLANCRFSLPEDENDLFFSATIRHLTEQESRAGSRHWRIGLHFDDLPMSAQNRIQRYIDKIERERHELA